MAADALAAATAFTRRLVSGVGVRTYLCGSSGDWLVKFRHGRLKQAEVPEKRYHKAKLIGLNVEASMWHEFGHHMHQQLGALDSGAYYRPPFETPLKTLFGARKLAPSDYAETDSKEQCAEFHAPHKMGRDEPIDPDWCLEDSSDRLMLADISGRISRTHSCVG